MPIASSVIAWDNSQKDRRRQVREVHTTTVGTRQVIDYLAENGADATITMTARVAGLNASLAANEIAHNLSLAVTLGAAASGRLTFNESTLAQNATAAREFYRTATRDDSAFLGEFLNGLTSVQLQAAFGLTAQQVITLKTNVLGPAATLAANIRAAVGQ